MHQNMNMYFIVKYLLFFLAQNDLISFMVVIFDRL